MQYLKVRPLQNYQCDCRLSYAKHWKPIKKFSFDIGHRGAGSGFDKQRKMSK